jgi:hypothetical protein
MVGTAKEGVEITRRKKYGTARLFLFFSLSFTVQSSSQPQARGSQVNFCLTGLSEKSAAFI